MTSELEGLFKFLIRKCLKTKPITVASSQLPFMNTQSEKIIVKQHSEKLMSKVNAQWAHRTITPA
jgi:hypothetical protein